MYNPLGLTTPGDRPGVHRPLARCISVQRPRAIGSAEEEHDMTLVSRPDAPPASEASLVVAVTTSLRRRLICHDTRGLLQGVLRIRTHGVR